MTIRVEVTGSHEREYQGVMDFRITANGDLEIFFKQEQFEKSVARAEVAWAAGHWRSLQRVQGP